MFGPLPRCPLVNARLFREVPGLHGPPVQDGTSATDLVQVYMAMEHVQSDPDGGNAIRLYFAVSRSLEVQEP